MSAPPRDCDACWLPGGYPELHGAALADAATSAPACCGSPRPGRCTASAAATWCWAPRWTDAERRARTRCSACSATPPALRAGNCISATARRRCCADCAARAGGQRGARPRVPLRQHHRSWHRRAAGDAERRAGPHARPGRRPARAGSAAHSSMPSHRFSTEFPHDPVRQLDALAAACRDLAGTATTARPRRCASARGS